MHYIVDMRYIMVQKARADLAWLAAQELKLRDFVGDAASKTLSLASLTKPQADFIAAIAPMYSLTMRPMPMLLGKHRLQLLKGTRASVPDPLLSEHARVLTDEDVAQLAAKEAANTFELRCAAQILIRSMSSAP